MSATLGRFQTDLRAFSIESTGRASATLQEAAQVTAEAVVLGNAYGPGAPLDTGFLRASFRVSRNVPEDGPRKGPPTPGRKDGDPAIYPSILDTSAAALAVIGETVYITTMAEYAIYLEEGSGGMRRRNGPSENVGAPTAFIAPVEARWLQIVDEAARRAGYGA